MKGHPIQCTRCKHKCDSSTWVDVPSKRYGGCTESTCPRCSCRNFYDLTPWFAWSWASGLIELGEQAPALADDGSGCIVFAKGPRSYLEAAIAVLARHGKGASSGKYLVPGVPEAANPTEAIDAFDKWVEWCKTGRTHYAKKDILFSSNPEELFR